MIKSPAKKESLQSLIKEADKWFSLYIRIADTNEQGKIYCFICGAQVYWRHSDCAHFNDRDYMATRYEQDNAWACCQTCNRFDPQHQVKYAEKLKQWNLEAYKRLLELKHNLMKFTRPELEEIINTYKTKFQELKKAKNL